eukprot:m.418176 g.418176  ORF g.418176 m.418176 type:complete len:101 (-) comp16834_c0_seq78:127-429(-)
MPNPSHWLLRHCAPRAALVARIQRGSISVVFSASEKRTTITGNWERGTLSLSDSEVRQLLQNSETRAQKIAAKWGSEPEPKPPTRRSILPFFRVKFDSES